MSSDHLTVSKDGEVFVLRSSDIDVKQAIFSWGSFGTGLRIKEHPEYYGQDVDPRSPPPGTVLRGEAAQKWATENTDDHLWEWRLTRESVEDLMGMIAGSLAPESPYRMAVEEVKASEHIIEVLKKATEDT
jgi:hypothetical protein